MLKRNFRNLNYTSVSKNHVYSHTYKKNVALSIRIEDILLNTVFSISISSF